MKKTDINEENVKYLEKISTNDLLLELQQEKDQDIPITEITELINKIQKQYKLNKRTMNSIIQKVWEEKKEIDESSLIKYAAELKKFKITNVIDALEIFIAIDKVAEQLKQEEEEKVKREAEEKVKQEEMLKQKEIERQMALELEEKNKKVFYDYITHTEPVIMLEDYRQGKKPFKNEVNLIEELKETGLPKYVINLLLQFVLENNSNKLPEAIVKKYAEILVETKFNNIDDTISYFNANIEYLAEVKMNVLASMDENKDLQYYDKKYISHLKAMYFMDEKIAVEIVRYSKNLNQNFLITWFTDKVTEFIVANDPKDVETTQLLLKEFHKKYIMPMGK